MLSNTMTDKPVYSDIFVSDRDILTEDDQNALIHMRDQHRLDYFFLGHLANRYFNQSVAMNLPVTARRIHEAIGRFVGKRPRTIRYYAEVSAFYVNQDITAFDSLPFSFFAYAVRYGDQWRDVLEYAAYNPFMSLDELQASYGRFSDAEKGDSEAVVQEALNEQKDLIEDPSLRDLRLPELATLTGLSAITEPAISTPRVMSRLASQVLLHQISDLVDQTQRLLRMTDLPDALRARLEIDVMDIKSALPELGRVLSQANKNPGRD